MNWREIINLKDKEISSHVTIAANLRAQILMLQDAALISAETDPVNPGKELLYFHINDR
jgi:hypothetical protein